MTLNTPDPAVLLAAYDNQLRTESEMAGARMWDRSGPLWLAKFRDAGFVSYRDLDGLTGAELSALIAATVDHFADDPVIESFEWKTRGHDAPAELDELLRSAGLVPEETETVMVGDAAALTQPVDPPAGVTVLRTDKLPDARSWLDRASVMQRQVFGRGPTGAEMADRLARGGGLIQEWVAHVDGEVVGAGRLEQVAHSDFGGLWGGSTSSHWRGRGVYRALTAARACSAVDSGLRYLNSDCTPMSRPILERSGLIAVTTTTPYVWTRA